MSVLVDTGALYAFLDARDRWREPVRKLFEEAREPLLVPVTVLPEAAYLLNKQGGARAERAMLEDIASGLFSLVHLLPADIRRMIVLLEQYQNLDLGLVDASVIAVAERLGITRIATTDRRDFSLVKPTHCEHFELLP